MLHEVSILVLNWLSNIWQKFSTGRPHSWYGSAFCSITKFGRLCNGNSFRDITNVIDWMMRMQSVKIQILIHLVNFNPYWNSTTVPEPMLVIRTINFESISNARTFENGLINIIDHQWHDSNRKPLTENSLG